MANISRDCHVILFLGVRDFLIAQKLVLIQTYSRIFRNIISNIHFQHCDKDFSRVSYKYAVLVAMTSSTHANMRGQIIMCISLYLTNQFPTINCHQSLVLLIISNLICIQNLYCFRNGRKTKNKF